MELLEQVVRKKAVLTFCLVLFCLFPVFSQNSKPANSPENVGLFPRPGFEPLAPHKSPVRDRSNIKPENFRFSDAKGRSLDDLLSVGAGKDAPDCKPSWAMFKFRLNGKGLIDSTWFDGQLPKEVSARILNNIRNTEGSWTVAPGTKEEDVAWYVYFYSDTRGRWDRNLNCSESDKELQATVSSMTAFFKNLFYLFGEDRATMVRPTGNDGYPKN
jgi:hypothetical protein